MNQTMRYRAANNQELVEHLKRKGVIKSQRIFDVMSKVDRKNYVNNHNPYNDAYIDSPQNIGNGRTISAPHMHAHVLETLNGKLFNGSKVLAIRCSAGYLSVCMALLVGPKGKVVQVESNHDVQYKVKGNIINDDPSLLVDKRIHFILDNEVNGYSLEAPYDVIYIGAAVFEVPQNIIDQLATDGYLLVPMMDADNSVNSQKLTLVKKTEFPGRLHFESLIPVSYGILNISQINENENSQKGDPKNLKARHVSVFSFSSKNVGNDTAAVPKNRGTAFSVYPKTAANNTLEVPKILETSSAHSVFGTNTTSTNSTLTVSKNIETSSLFDATTTTNSTPTASKNLFERTSLFCKKSAANSTLETPKHIETLVSHSSLDASAITNTTSTASKIRLKNYTSLSSVKAATNNSLVVPKILETPVPVSPFSEANIENGTPSVPKILETPVSVTTCRVKHVGHKTSINNANDNCQKDEIKSQPGIDKQNFDSVDIYANSNNAIIKSNLDSLEERFSELKNAFRKNLRASSILKQSNHNKFYAIEKTCVHLDNELNAMKNSFEQKMIEQCVNATKQLSINIDKNTEILLKLNRRLTNKSVIIEKNITILERKLNKKIAKLKRIMEDKINDEGKLLIKELSLFKVSIEDKLAKENAAFCEEISGEFDKRDYLLMRSKLKEQLVLLCLRNVEKNDPDEGKRVSPNEQNNRNTAGLAFCAIITLHTILTISKIVS